MALPNHDPQLRLKECQDDILIAVMGSTGSGKSSFIKLLTGDSSIKIGDSLQSETDDVKEYRISDRGRNLGIIDTPGFDDSRRHITDTEVLRRITKFLLQAYDENRKLNGIIYLHRISDPRFTGQSARNLMMFEKLCGATTFKNVVVLTTFWDDISCEARGIEREMELRKGACEALATGGAVFMRHKNVLETATPVLEYIYTLAAKNVRITEEIREEGKQFEDTDAASAHREEVQQMVAEHKEEMIALEAQLNGMTEGEEALRRYLEEERAVMKEKFARWETEILDLGVGLEEERKVRKPLEPENTALALHPGTSEGQNDILIAVMGATGSGKSSFIKLLTGDSSIKIGHSLSSETDDVKEYYFSNQGRNVAIIDTPGFSDSREEITDTEILRRIKDFLLQAYDKRRKLNGIIYLLRISDNRFDGQSTRSLNLFKKLCGTEAFENVVVLTTHWDNVSDDRGVKREVDLKTNACKALATGGAAFMRHNNTFETATRVLEHIYTLTPQNVQITKEIREEGKQFEDTDAASAHRDDALRIIAELQKQVANLKAELDQVKQGEEELRRQLEEEKAAAKKKAARWEAEISELKKGLGKKGNDEHQSDTLIAVVGCTGSGKSSFIKLLTSDATIKIGDGLESQTANVKQYRFSDRGQNLVIIDTPGFVDSLTEVADIVSLQKITDFLFKTYNKDRKLDGIIYLHRISANLRSSGQPTHNLRTLKSICGTLENFVVLTTHWDQLPFQEEGVGREQQLEEKFREDFENAGIVFLRHDNKLESARRVLGHIVHVDAEAHSDHREDSYGRHRN